jgi:hypothetical protein
MTTVPKVSGEGEERFSRYSDEDETRAVEVLVFFDNLANCSYRDGYEPLLSKTS